MSKISMKYILVVLIFAALIISAGCTSMQSQSQSQSVASAESNLTDEEKTFILSQLSSAVKSELNQKLIDTPVSYVDVNGAHIGYREFGIENEKPMVVLIGYTGCMDYWGGDFIYSLAKDYHVYIYDHRGMGYSTDNGTQYEFDQLAADCVGLMKELGHEKFYLVGHSMGSMIAQVAIVKYPKNIEKAIIISTLPNIYTPEAEFIKSCVFKLAENPDFNDGIYRESIALIEYKGVIDELKNVTTDTLVIVGTDDLISPEKASLDVACEIEGSWFIRFKGCSHRVWEEVPMRLCDSIKFFCDMDIHYEAE